MANDIGTPFVCAICGETFLRARTHEDCMEEHRRHFGKTLSTEQEEMAIVCEDCFKLIDPETHPHMVEQAVAEVIRSRQPSP